MRNECVVPSSEGIDRAKSRRPQKVSDSLLKLVSNASVYLIPCSFIFGLALPLFGLGIYFLTKGPFITDDIIAFCVLSTISFILSYIFYKFLKDNIDKRGEIVLDKGKDILSLPNRKIPLSSIHALQLLPQYVSESTFVGGVNAVLKDEKRINLIDMGDLEGTKNDAVEIATFLGVQLWELPIKNKPID